MLIAEDASVAGCIDIRLPRAVTGVQPAGIPADDLRGAYLVNVVVREDSRGRGLGKMLMREAMRRSIDLWGAEHLYTHVEADNEVGGGRGVDVCVGGGLRTCTIRCVGGGVMCAFGGRGILCVRGGGEDE